MSIINVNSLDALVNHGFQKISVAFGVFDGVHLGHCKLIHKLIQVAKETSSDPIVITFYPHPKKVLSPHDSPLILISHEKKLLLLEQLGVKAVVTLPFTQEFSNLSADDFLDDCLYAPEVIIKSICVGTEWRFGKKGEGDIDVIRSYTKNHSFQFEPVPELLINNVKISSTAIRRAVSSGLLTDVEEMLGRHYSLSGEVISGHAIGKDILACPTANISVKNAIIPPNGVYAGYAIIDDKKHQAAISVGVSPTFAGKHRKVSDIEIHILDFDSNLYGEELDAEFVQYIREERAFPSSEALKLQVIEDIKQIRSVLKKV